MRRSFLLLCLTAAALHAQTPLRMTVDDAVRTAQEKSRLLLISDARVKGSDARAHEARAALFPSLKAQAAYHRLSDVDPFAVRLPFLAAPVVISPTLLNSTSGMLTLQQPLFTGFRLAQASRAASLLAEASQEDRRMELADLSLTVKSAYWSFYQAMQVKGYVDENIARLEADVVDTERMMKAGLATRNDLLRMQVQLSIARLAQVDAANEVELARMTLNNTMGQPLDTPLELVSVPSEELTAADSADQGGALAVRPDLKAMEVRVQAAEAAAAAARGAWWPQLFLTGSLLSARPNPRYLPARDEFKSTWDVGIQLSLDLWNGGATSAQVDQADAALRQASLQRDQLRETIALEVRRQTLGLGRARQKILLARTAVEQASENLRVMKDKHRSGLATSADLLDAEVSALQSKTSLTGALVELELARARSERALGRAP